MREAIDQALGRRDRDLRAEHGDLSTVASVHDPGLIDDEADRLLSPCVCATHPGADPTKYHSPCPFFYVLLQFRVCR